MLAGAATGHGRGALVGGESGVGKSRLLDELRARALVEGVTVLRGQAVSDGGGPYHVFREVLQGMVLAADVDDLEASVLQAVCPRSTRSSIAPSPTGPRWIPTRRRPGSSR